MSSIDARYNSEIFRKNHPIILAIRRELAVILPGRLDNVSADYAAGQVVARDTSDGLFKKWSAVSGGTYDTVSVLLEDAAYPEDFVEGETGVTGSALARICTAGYVFKDKLTELDAQAISDMAAKTIVGAGGTNILKF